MNPISLQNTLQNQYLGVNDQDTPLTPVLETHLVQPKIREDTILQYSDSALHNPADQTVYQKITPISAEEPDQTVYQVNAPQTQQSQTLVKNTQIHQPTLPASYISQEVLSGSGSVSSRLSSLTGTLLYSARQMFNPMQWQARLRPNQQMLTEKCRGKGQSHQPSPKELPTEAHISLEQYQKTLRELDDCRFSYAKEMARQGKFRDAIAMASKITETSRHGKDAQTLIRTWKKF